MACLYSNDNVGIDCLEELGDLLRARAGVQSPGPAAELMSGTPDEGQGPGPEAEIAVAAPATATDAPVRAYARTREEVP